MIERYAVIGNPVEHSQSPFIHAEFARAEHRSLHYERLLAPLDRFDEVAAAFFSSGGKGLNVTLPFKEAAYRYASEVSERAQLSCAVNTLTNHNGHIHGDNTDGVGLVRDIMHNLDVSIAGKKILILGAGGAVRGVLGTLLEQHPSNLTIANRTLQKAQAVVQAFSHLGPCQAVDYPALAGLSFDIVINATSASLQNTLPPIPVGLFNKHSLAYDMVYQRGLTLFLQRAQAEHAAMLADGLGMLVEQAVESYYIWHHLRPHSQPVMNQLRHILA